MHQFLISCKVGWLLGKRQIQRTSLWTTLLIIFVMVLTFLNLVVVSGILVGLIEGGSVANREQYTGDVIFLTPEGESFIENSPRVLRTLAALPEVENFSPRYTSGGQIEANYQNRHDPNEERDTVGTLLAGINPVIENEVTGLSNYVVEGEYLAPRDEGYILLGANLLRRYSSNFGDNFDSLDEVYPGDRVKVSVGDVEQELIVKGIIDSKVGDVSIRAFMIDTQLRRMIGRTNLNVNEISVIAQEGVTAPELKHIVEASGLADTADVRTDQEAIPQFLNDIKVAFALLGNVIGVIGLIVAIVTIFIVVFINALTRKKYIGILKGIGIKASAIEFAYVMQALFYAFVGSLIGIVLLYAVLQPYFALNPLDFPFSDGILVAPVGETLGRLLVLLVTTAIAGFIPARLIIKKNTLNSILGR